MTRPLFTYALMLLVCAAFGLALAMHTDPTTARAFFGL